MARALGRHEVLCMIPGFPEVDSGALYTAIQFSRNWHIIGEEIPWHNLRRSPQAVTNLQLPRRSHFLQYVENLCFSAHREAICIRVYRGFLFHSFVPQHDFCTNLHSRSNTTMDDPRDLIIAMPISAAALEMIERISRLLCAS